jgi:hypothetical protein
MAWYGIHEDIPFRQAVAIASLVLDAIVQGDGWMARVADRGELRDAAVSLRDWLNDTRTHCDGDVDALLEKIREGLDANPG